MLYGRFATSLRGGGSSAATSSGSASPQWTVGALDAGEVRLERAVELDRVHVRDARGEEAREDAEAGPDLEHDVVGLELGEALDHAEDVLVDEEVLAERLPRRDAHSPNAASRSRRSAASSPRPRRAARRAKRGVHDVRRLVAAAADRLRREVRAVGLGEQAVGRHAPGAPSRSS